MLNPSLKARVVHVVFKFATLLLGAAYVAGPAVRFRRRLGNRTGSASHGRAALVAHVFYVDLLDEIRDCFDCFPADADLLVTAPADKVSAVGAFFGSRPNVRIVPVENRGRDIAPFLLLLNEGLLEPYDAVLKLHTKKSPHLRDGNIRRRLLYAMLAGSRRRVAEVIDLFRSPTTGLVGWHLAWRTRPPFWMANRERVEDLCRRMELPIPGAPAFFEGSMFWVRPAALRPLRSLGLTAADFEPEARQLDGTLHHAVERIFDAVVRGEGCETLDLRGRPLA